MKPKVVGEEREILAPPGTLARLPQEASSAPNRLESFPSADFDNRNSPGLESVPSADFDNRNHSPGLNTALDAENWTFGLEKAEDRTSFLDMMIPGAHGRLSPDRSVTN